MMSPFSSIDVYALRCWPHLSISINFDAFQACVKFVQSTTNRSVDQCVARAENDASHQRRVVFELDAQVVSRELFKCRRKVLAFFVAEAMCGGDLGRENAPFPFGPGDEVFENTRPHAAPVFIDQ